MDTQKLDQGGRGGKSGAFACYQYCGEREGVGEDDTW